jgi:CRISPR-associated exonuclease Cas4
VLDTTLELPFRVSDLKQWDYCPRIWYYHHCLPDVRPITYKMQHGIESGLHTEELESRRSLRAYGLTQGERSYNVQLTSLKFGLRGVADMVIETQFKGAAAWIPVDFKESRIEGPHFKLQLAAYALMLEELHGCVVRRGFLYMIPLRRAVEVPIDRRLRRQVLTALEGMRGVMEHETMPKPTTNLGKCAVCEFRRFCNDVL